jgi:hypothetical protein
MSSFAWARVVVSQFAFLRASLAGAGLAPPVRRLGPERRIGRARAVRPAQAILFWPPLD